MGNYTCPICQQPMERDLAAFLDHAQSHIIDAVKKENPDWVRKDGMCPKCHEYYEKAMRGETIPEKKKKKNF